VEHLLLPVLDLEETKVVTKEMMEVERLEDGAFRLLHSPALISGIAGGDVIELDETALSGLRVRSRAGNVAVVVAVKDDAEKGAPAVRSLIEEVAALGGVYEGGPKRTLVFTIPVQAGFERIEAVFDAFRGTQGGAEWWYGNVLDRNDQPLGWWKAQNSV